jgi:hypothetical protein
MEESEFDEKEEKQEKKKKERKNKTQHNLNTSKTNKILITKIYNINKIEKNKLIAELISIAEGKKNKDKIFVHMLEF